MNQKNVKLAAAMCAALFFLALLLCILISPKTPGGDDSASGRIVLSEILPSNRTCPSPDGRYLDYIEIHNASSEAVDISGYMLSDDLTSIGYTFPTGTVLAPGGYAVCWCDPDGENESYASFGISKSGGEIITLYNSANVVIDQVELPRTNGGTALLREENNWVTSVLLTPGYENSEAGFEAWLHAMGADAMQVVISEVMTANTCIRVGDMVCDWIELYNSGKEPADLDGCYLSDDPADPLKWKIENLTLQPGEYALIRCAGTEAQPGDADFSLSRSGCTVTLTGKLGNTVSKAECTASHNDHSFVLAEDGSYSQSSTATPGYENSESGYAQWLSSVTDASINIVITEIVASNYSTILSENGQLCDWIELRNDGDSPVILDGCYLSDDPANRAKWQIPSLTLQPGEYAVIPCAADLAGSNEAPFALSKNGGSVLITGTAGNVLCQVDYPTLGNDRSWALQSGNTYAQTHLLSPGYENTEEGCLSYRMSQKVTGPLIISEVMSANNRYLQQSDGEYYDWVELTNISDNSIDLSGYCLSDDPGKLQRFQLPEKTLAPGESTVIICSGDVSLTGRYAHAPFTLGYDESWVYLTGPDGGLADYIRIFDVPYRASVGRMEGKNGTYYFTTPTPLSPNGAGVASISATPEVHTPGGVYNGVNQVTVEISGAGQLHYTLDGSIPTQNDPVYTAPLKLDQTTVVRVAAWEDGKLRSDVKSISYIINENHTLPVISLSAQDSALFGANGIYTNYTQNQEIPCNFTYIENGEEFSIDCGLKLYGHTALQLPKKNFKVNFRGVYGTDYLSYPMFGEDGPEIFDSLCIRAGQDNPRAIIRDEVFASLAEDMGDHVLVQKSKYCIVYVNGAYFGIYALKEAFNETYYAQNKGVSAESVQIVQAPFGYGELFDLRSYCMKNDLSIDKHYEYVASKIDIESIIDWMIIQGYTANGDTQQNLRYFRSTETGNRWQLAFYDLDWAMYEHCAFSNMFDPNQPWQHKGITRNLIKNEKFRQQFIERVSDMLHSVLSDENVIARIDHFEQILDPEVKRDRAKWGGSYSGWQSNVQRLRNFITTGGHMDNIVTRLTRYLELSRSEVKQYFGDLT